MCIRDSNLDVIRASDWLIDLGPEGGEGGGQVVAQGTPEEVRLHPTSHTAKALREYALAFGAEHAVHEVREGSVASYLRTAVPVAALQSNSIRIVNAREHNLKMCIRDSLYIRTGELTVVTGPSGSGKSSLVFDTLFAEGQRRYVETFSAYARQFLDRMDKPAVDRVDGVPPAIAIDQTNPVRSSRSTVGTMTELNDHLKLLFARGAHLFDRVTAHPVRQDSADTILAELQHLSLIHI